MRELVEVVFSGILAEGDGLNGGELLGRWWLKAGDA